MIDFCIESKCELQFASHTSNLRMLGDDVWQSFCTAAGVQILSKLQGPSCDSYLLSQSSLFVFSERLVLITCGSTDLTAALEQLNRVVSLQNLTIVVFEIRSLIHGRSIVVDEKLAMHPLLKHLKSQLKEATKITLSNQMDIRLERRSHISIYGIPKESLEMFDWKNNHQTRARHDLVRSLTHSNSFDEHLFQPQGYSFNALSEDGYATLHVSPELNFASFENSGSLVEIDVMPILKGVFGNTEGINFVNV